MSYSIIPPKVQTVQSAPDVFLKIVFSASIANFRISSLEYFVNKPDIEAAAATQHAEEEPNPTPEGKDESIVTSIPPLLPNFSRRVFDRYMKGMKGDLISSNDFDLGIVIFPKFDLITIESSSVVNEVTLTLLSIEHRIALIPYTTKCSPKRMTFPGAEAIDFK